MQGRAGHAPDLVGRGRAVVDLAAIRRNDLLQARLPAGVRHLLGERLGHQVQHDVGRRRCAGRGAHQGRDGAVGVGHDLRPELQHGALFRVALDHLHALPRGDQAPVLAPGLREVGLQFLVAVFVGEFRLLQQVLHQVQIVDAHAQHAHEVVVRDGGEQVEPGAVLEELRGGQCEGTEEYDRLAVQVAGVHMRDRHRRGAGRGNAVCLYVMARSEFGVFGGEELPAHGEARVVLRLGNARCLQQLEGRTAGAHEDEAGLDGLFLAALGQLGHGHVPGLVGVLAQRAHFVLQAQCEVRVLAQARHELVRHRAVVHVGAQGHVGGGHLLGRIAALDHQRSPLPDLGLVLRVLHAVEERIAHQCGMPLAQVGDVVVTPDEAHVGRRVDEGARRLHGAPADLVRPELARHLELLGDAHRAPGFDGAVGKLGGVVQFREARMPGACVVPAIGAFQGHAVQALEDLDLPVGLQLLQVGGQRGAHGAGTDHRDIDGLVVVGGRDGVGEEGPVQKQYSGQGEHQQGAGQGFDRLFHGARRQRAKKPAVRNGQAGRCYRRTGIFGSGILPSK